MKIVVLEKKLEQYTLTAESESGIFVRGETSFVDGSPVVNATVHNEEGVSIGQVNLSVHDGKINMNAYGIAIADMTDVCAISQSVINEMLTNVESAISSGEVAKAARLSGELKKL